MRVRIGYVVEFLLSQWPAGVGGERSGLSGSWPLRREVAGGHVAERTVWADLNNDSFMDLYVGDY